MIDFRTNSYQRYESFALPDYTGYAASYARRLERWLSVSRDMRCLDVACGFGNFLSYLESRNVSSYLGVDSSVPAVNAVKQRFGDAHGVCEDTFVFLGSCRHSFDLISALDFMEHLTKHELHTFIDLVGQRLAISGKFLIRVPNAAGLFGMASRYNDITHEVCFTPNALRDVLMTHGFKTIAVWEDTGRPAKPVQYVHRGLWEIVRFGIRALDAIETGMWGEGVLTRNMWALAERMPVRATR